MPTLSSALAWGSTGLALALGGYVFWLVPTALTNRLFALFALALSAWPLSFALAGLVPTDALAYVQALATAGSLQIGNVFCHFALAHARRREWLANRWLMPLLYAATALLWTAVYSPLGFRQPAPAVPGLAAALPPLSPAFVFAVAESGLVFTAGLAVCARHAFTAAQTQERRQAAWIAGGGGAVLVYGLVTTVLPDWLFGLNLGRYSVLGVPLVAVPIAYAMSRHRLLSFDPGRIVAVILDSVPSAVVVVDRRGTLQAVNRTAERLTDGEARDLLGAAVGSWLPLLEGVPWGDPVGVLFHKRAATLVRVREEPIPVSVTASPLRDRRRRITGTILFVDDERAGESIRQQAMQSERLATIGRLAGGVAHDFNNILTSILGYAELLEDRLGKGSPRLKEVQQITAAATRAAALTRQLLAFSRRQMLVLEPHDLNDTLRGAAPLLEQALGPEIRLRLDLAPALPPARLDAGQTQQVLLVLAQNARDAMPGGGTFTLATAALTVPPGEKGPGGLPAGGYAVLKASDTGPGIPPDVQPHLFEPFFTTKPRGQGTGMGLATVYGYVKQSEGHVEAASEPGRGAEFRIYLPASPAAEPAADAAEARPAARRRPARRGGAETVLLVEDERPLREAVQMMLEDRGFKVLTATGGDDALAVIAAHRGRYDALVTDVLMPGMDGPTLAERLRADRPDLKVLFISGFSDKAALQRELAKTGGAFLAKPFSGDAVAAAVRELLER